ncbi:MAG: WGR domain-containing protein [Sandaracinaceae bacterium]|nr:WGR domain-containing protein [Sandaracinaceae bacterium]
MSGERQSGPPARVRQDVDPALAPSSVLPIRRTVLHSLEPSDNRFRFFVVEQRPELDGRVSLVRRWGRVGLQGRIAVDATGTPEQIAQAHDALVTLRLRRGYRVVEEGPAAAGDVAPARTLGALAREEAKLVDALALTRARMRAVREAMRPTPPAPSTTAACSPVQLELFTAAS